MFECVRVLQYTRARVSFNVSGTVQSVQLSNRKASGERRTNVSRDNGAKISSYFCIVFNPQYQLFIICLFDRAGVNQKSNMAEEVFVGWLPRERNTKIIYVNFRNYQIITCRRRVSFIYFSVTKRSIYGPVNRSASLFRTGEFFRANVTHSLLTN